MKRKYEYTEIKGGPRESGVGTYPVTVENIDAMANEGWRFVAFGVNHHTAIMERKVKNGPINETMVERLIRIQEEVREAMMKNEVKNQRLRL